MIQIYFELEGNMDLSQIFKPKTEVSSPNRLSFSSMSSSRHSASPRQSWDLDHLENSMRRGVKKQVTAQSMSEQLKIFYNTQKDVLINKGIIISIFTYLLIYFTGMQGSIAFTGIMLAAVEILFKLIIPANIKGLIENVRAIQPLIYCSIFYSLLKWMSGMNNAVLHWPMTVVSIIATFAHVIVRIYEPYVSIFSYKIIGNIVNEKKGIKRFVKFWKYELCKVNTIRNMAKHFILALSLTSMAFLGILIYFGLLSIQIFQMRYILSSIFVFLSLQIYLDFITYINLTFSHNLKFIRLMQDKLPIFISLLRLKKQSTNQQIHNECLKYLYIKISEVNNFLSTETYKSIIYSTYIDIFNQYASLELERLNLELMNFVAKVKLNDAIVRSEKTMVHDLLIYYRKFTAYVASQWEFSKMLRQLSNLNYLFLVINKIQGENQNEQTRVSRRVVNLVKAISERLKECSQRQSLTIYSRSQICLSQQTIILTTINNEE